MFNEERKKEFQSHKMDMATYNDYYIFNAFGKTEKFEKELNRDACNFSTSEIKDMYKRLNFNYYNTILMFNSLMVSYTDWCFKKGYVTDSQNHYTEFDSETLSELVNKYVLTSRVVSRETVINWCSILPNYVDKFLVLGIFEGIAGDNYIEITEIKNTDIDVKNSKINIYGRGWLEFSNELCEYARESCDVFTYESLHDNKFTKVNLENTPNAFKSRDNTKIVPNQFRKGRRVYTRLKRIFVYLGIGDCFRAKDLANSGIIDYINKKATEAGVSGKEYLFEHIDEINKRFNRSLRDKRFYEQYKDFLA